jgi:hypothetical protein
LPTTLFSLRRIQWDIIINLLRTSRKELTAPVTYKDMIKLIVDFTILWQVPKNVSCAMKYSSGMNRYRKTLLENSDCIHFFIFFHQLKVSKCHYVNQFQWIIAIQYDSTAVTILADIFQHKYELKCAYNNNGLCVLVMLAGSGHLVTIVHSLHALIINNHHS